jgi:hypothetical protein
LRCWRHLGTGAHSFRIGRTVRYRYHGVTTWLQQQSSAGDQPPTQDREVKPPAGRAVEPGPATFGRSSRGFAHRKMRSRALARAVATTFGGTCPDLRKGQRTPGGVRARGDEVGDVPTP